MDQRTINKTKAANKTKAPVLVTAKKISSVNEDVKMQHGHRARLRKRFFKNSSFLEDYEILEMLLDFAIPVKNNNPLAKRLLNIYGSFGNLLSEKHSNLTKIPGLGEKSALLLKLVSTAWSRNILRELETKNAFSRWHKILDYCMHNFSSNLVENLHALYFNSHLHLIDQELLQTGSINRANIFFRQIVQNSLNFGAKSIVLVHNHPSGNPTPSREDIKVTAEIKKTLKAVDIDLIDHIIIGKNCYYSMKNKNIL